MPLSSQTNSDKKALAKKGYKSIQVSNIGTNYNRKTSNFLQIRGNGDATTLFIEEMAEGKKNMKGGKGKPASQEKIGKSEPVSSSRSKGGRASTTTSTSGGSKKGGSSGSNSS